MMGPNVVVQSSDAHPIIDIETNKAINKGSDVEIGNHVWMTTNVMIMKGAKIANDCIIAANSIVSKSCLTPNAIYAGTPAKIIKENVTWNYEFPN